jgi:hypothetical protein
MSFAIRNLSVIGYAQGFTLYHYRANVDTLGATIAKATTLATVTAEGFFAPAADMLAPGDIILVSAVDGVAQLYVTNRGGETRMMAATP